MTQINDLYYIQIINLCWRKHLTALKCMVGLKVQNKWWKQKGFKCNWTTKQIHV